MTTLRARILGPVVAATAALVAVVLPGVTIPPAGAQPKTPTCANTPSSVVTGVEIADPACVFNGVGYTGALFAPIDNASGKPSTVYAGILPDGSAYRVEVPPAWNGTLVMYAHGYRGQGNVVFVDEPQLRQYFVDHGYAWAASSYDENGYDVGSGVVDTHDLLEAFPSLTGLTPTSVIMSGLSMGGAITAVEIEHYKGDFVGAMPYCGVLGGNALFDYFLGANVTAAGLTHTQISYPEALTTAGAVAAGAAYAPKYDAAVVSELSTLGITPGSQGFTNDFTRTGQLWADTVEQLSGGTRPGFASAIGYWDAFGFPPLTNIPFLFGLYPGLTGGTIGYAPGNVAGNETTLYRFTNRPVPPPAVRELNDEVLRVARTAPFSSNPNVTELPDVVGDPGIPVLSVHGIGDLFVPLSMDQTYARLMAEHGEGSLFVDRAIREVTHCGYTNSELSSAFSALVNWIQTGRRPAGDNILDPKVVASPHFGCRFTDPTPGAHRYFQGPACPTSLRPGNGNGRGNGNGAG